MELHDWDVKTKGDSCVHITINEDVDIKEMELVLLSETRAPIIKMKVSSRDIFLCWHIEKPMFVQIGHSVKYVSGSGGEFYKDVLEHKN